MSGPDLTIYLQYSFSIKIHYSYIHEIKADVKEFYNFTTEYLASLI